MAWRALRAELLKHGEEARKTAAAAHEDVRRAAARARTLAVVPAALAALAAGLFLLLSQRTVRRELGGEPPDWAAPQPSFTTGS